MQKVKTHQQIEIELHKDLIIEYRKRYDPEYSKIFQKYWNNEITRELGNDNNLRILDFGCGTGVLVNDLACKYGSVFGLDISLDMLQEFKQVVLNGKRVNFMVGDGENLPFKKERLDVIVCRGSLHHLASIDKALEEIYRVLSPGGTLMLSEPCNDSFVIRMVRKVMYKKSTKFSEDDEGYITKELCNCLTKHGFKVGKVKKFGFLSYIFAGFPDKLPFLGKIPFNSLVTRVLIMVDRVLAVVPLINSNSLHVMVKAEKVSLI